MMRSLWSGVSGLRVHQVGMDVEGNNIANVNTNGFKYSRVNYATMFSQTLSIATQPTSTRGGTNAKQVGLGVSANSTQRIHSQGSISGTDSNFDAALSGNGFFLVSGDGGKTQYLTRDGQFNQDSAGNFVNMSGYVVQGWNRNETTGKVDTTLPASNIWWDPSMTLPAKASTEISLSASLNSGSTIDSGTSRYIFGLDSVHGYRTANKAKFNENSTSNTAQFYTTSSDALDVTEKAVDFASVFNGDTYESANLRNGQSFWVSFKDSTYSTHSQDNGTYQLLDYNSTAAQTSRIYWGNSTTSVVLDITINGQRITNNSITSIDEAVSFINQYTTDVGTRKGTGVTAEASVDGLGINFRNQNATGETADSKNIDLVINSANTAGELWNYAGGVNGAITYTGNVTGGASTWTNTLSDTNAIVGANVGAAADAAAAAAAVRAAFAAHVTTYQQRLIDAANDAAAVAGATVADVANALTAVSMEKEIITAHLYTYRSTSVEIGDMYNPDNATMEFDATIDVNTGTFANSASLNYVNALSGSLLNKDVRVFHTTEDLRELVQRDARYGVDYDSSGDFEITDINEKVTLVVNNTGNYVFANPNEENDIAGTGATEAGTMIRALVGVTDPTLAALQTTLNNMFQANANGTNTTISAKNMSFQVSTYSNETTQVSSNSRLVNMFQTWTGDLPTGSTESKSSSSLMLSSYSTSLRVYDSLGSLHLIRVEWNKQSTTLDGGNEWQMILRIDEPATFNGTGTGYDNIIVGTVRFKNDGSLSSYSPTTVTFSGNNGSAPNQVIYLNLGASGAYNGLVSNNQTSALTQQATDGYEPGVLNKGMQNVSIASNGDIIGSFSNGQTLTLARIAIGTVVNDAGLEEIGSNLLRTTGNSGDLTIGEAGTGGRAELKSSSLEMSNADLSLALTNLIVIQRGYQANSKTITTSDTMLNTLLQLKQ